MATNQRLNAKITIGGAVSRSLIGGLSRTETQIGQVGDALKTLKKRQAGLERYRDNWRDMGRDVSHVNDRLERTNRLIGKLQNNQNRLGRIRGAQDANMQRRENLQGQMGGLVALGATMAAPIAAAVKFESTMADLNKVADLTDEQFQATRKSILGMSREMPMAQDQIGSIMTAAAQSGIARDQMDRFTETAIQMGVAFDMTGQEAGSMLANWRAGMKLTQDEVEDLADLTNHLSNNMNATAPDIGQVVQRMGAVAQTAGLAKETVAGMSAAMLSSGTAPERVGTALKNMTGALTRGESATARQREAFKSLGMDASTVSKRMQEDAEGTIRDVFQRMADLDKADRPAVLSNLVGEEGKAAIAPLLNNMENLDKALNMSGDSAAYSGSMLAEYEERAKTTANNLQLFKNRVTGLGISLGTVLLPAVNMVVGGVGTMATKVATVAEQFPFATKVVVGATVALVGLKVAAVAGGWAWTFVKGGALSAAGALTRAHSAILVSSAAAKTGAARVGAMTAANYALASSGGVAALSIKGIGMALMANPIGIAVGAIVAGAMLIYKFWEPLKAFFVGLGQGFAEAFGPVAPIFSAIGSAIGTVVGWFTSLLTPVDMSTESLKEVGNWGKWVGEILGTLFKWSPMGLLLKSWGPVLDWFKGLGDTIGAVADWLGFGDDETEQKSPRAQVGAAAGRRPSADPGAGVARARDGSRIEDNSTTTVQVNQQPGEDGEALAERVAQKMDERKRQRGRGALYDRGPAYGY